MEQITFDAIETDAGIFLKRCNVNVKDAGFLFSITNLSFDGELPTNTHHEKWVKIKGMPKRVTYFTRPQPINLRFELIDTSLASEKIPLSIPRDEAGGGISVYDFEWYDNYKNLQSLYHLIHDTTEPQEVEVEVKFNILCKVANIPDYESFSYATPKERSFGSKEIVMLTEYNIKHQVIDEILFPDLLLATKPCRLSSKETYGIIRQFVKSNINPQYAEITSDYDFCFTVEKRIPLAKPYKTSREDKNKKGGSYHPPRITETLHVVRKKVIFEMTNDKDKYNGYTPIAGFIGENQSDLKNNIDCYLKELINYINAPIIECPHCQGMGVTMPEVNQPTI